MRSNLRRTWCSIGQKTTVTALAISVAGASFSPLAAAPAKRRPKGKSRVARTATATIQAGKRIERGVEGALKSVERTLSPSRYIAANVPFGPIIVREAKKNGLKPELVAAVIKQESKFKPHAKSPAGAIGLMQLLPRTGHWMGAKNLRNPEQNIVAGTKYLKYLTREFKGNEKKIIAAYNAGPRNVHKFGGTPPFRETRRYVKNVLQYRDAFLKAAASKSDS